MSFISENSTAIIAVISTLAFILSVANMVITLLGIRTVVKVKLEQSNDNMPTIEVYNLSNKPITIINCGFINDAGIDIQPSELDDWGTDLKLPVYMPPHDVKIFKVHCIFDVIKKRKIHGVFAKIQTGKRFEDKVRW